jgi:glycosyltransferase involved in cell wall biosynthesis
VDSLVQTLKNVLPLSASELFDMGQNGRKLIEEKYIIEKTARQMLELYKTIK